MVEPGRRLDHQDGFDGRLAPAARPDLVQRFQGVDRDATKSMAVELAPKNIRVNCLCPVAGETGMLPSFMGEDTREKRRCSGPRSALGGCPRRSTSPLPRPLAGLRTRAAFITGGALEVDGGRCI